MIAGTFGGRHETSARRMLVARREDLVRTLGREGRLHHQLALVGERIGKADDDRVAVAMIEPDRDAVLLGGFPGGITTMSTTIAVALYLPSLAPWWNPSSSKEIS